MRRNTAGKRRPEAAKTGDRLCVRHTLNASQHRSTAAAPRCAGDRPELETSPTTIPKLRLCMYCHVLCAGRGGRLGVQPSRARSRINFPITRVLDGPKMREHLTAAHFVRRRRTRCSSCSREDSAWRDVLRFSRSCRGRSQRPPTYPSPMCSDTHVPARRAKRKLDGAVALELSCLRTRAPVLGQLVDPSYRAHPRHIDTLIVDRDDVLCSHPSHPRSTALAIPRLVQPPRGAG